MREVRIHLPEADVDEIAQIAFAAGISSLSLNPEERRKAGGETSRIIALEAATSTPKAHQFIAAVLDAPCYERSKYTINVKSPRSIVSSEEIREITLPRLEPVTDVTEELWQFCHLTLGYCGRVLIGAGLLALGLVENKMLLIIAGLLFLPLLPTLTGISFGVLTREWPLARRALVTLCAGLLITFAAAALIGLVTTPPVRFSDFSSMPISVLISAAVGVAAALANTDDAGRRELIGLAAAAQIAMLPAWLGLALTMEVREGSEIIVQRAITLLLNLVAIVLTSLATFLSLRYRAMRG
jgi:hypothetical protein